MGTPTCIKKNYTFGWMKKNLEFIVSETYSIFDPLKNDLRLENPSWKKSQFNVCFAKMMCANSTLCSLTIYCPQLLLYSMTFFWTTAFLCHFSRQYISRNFSHIFQNDLIFFVNVGNTILKTINNLSLPFKKMYTSVIILRFFCRNDGLEFIKSYRDEVVHDSKT